MFLRQLVCGLVVLGSMLGGCSGASAPRPAATATGPVEYRIGPGDTLSIFVFNHPELSLSLPVRPDGKISAPLVEDVEASGKTPNELARDLETRLAEYLRSPKVSVMVTGFVGGDRVRVVGQAAAARSIPYRANLTLLDVMIEVGGLAEFAAGNRAKIVRTVDGKTTEMRVRIDDLLRNGDISANVAMLPGDVVIIPESRF